MSEGCVSLNQSWSSSSDEEDRPPLPSPADMDLWHEIFQVDAPVRKHFHEMITSGWDYKQEATAANQLKIKQEIAETFGPEDANTSNEERHKMEAELDEKWTKTLVSLEWIVSLRKATKESQELFTRSLGDFNRKVQNLLSTKHPEFTKGMMFGLVLFDDVPPSKRGVINKSKEISKKIKLRSRNASKAEHTLDEAEPSGLVDSEWSLMMEGPTQKSLKQLQNAYSKLALDQSQSRPKTCESSY